MKRFARWRGLCLLVLVLTLAACGDGPKAPAFKTTDISGADFGKGFDLVDTAGKTTTLADFKGKVTVLFFGFTHCPDVCPTTLSELAVVKKQLGADGDRMQVVFVTLDPERDRPDVLKAYVPAFDPSFVALSGDPAAIARAAQEFKVYYKKVPGSTPENYTLDHTAAAFVFDPKGRLRLFSSFGQGPEALTHDIRLLLREGS
ncbi:MAG TPA: SCO family protein [Burkholderiales bacterium]|nr:SCO family protein [Betaproteobacteria bacterium]HQR52267.1 SCO family protein [Burkholderiales bacterium]